MFDPTNPVEIFAASDDVILGNVESFKLQPRYDLGLGCSVYDMIYSVRIEEVYKGNVELNKVIDVKAYEVFAPRSKALDYFSSNREKWGLSAKDDTNDKLIFASLSLKEDVEPEIGKKYLFYLGEIDNGKVFDNVAYQYSVREVKNKSNSNEVLVLDNSTKEWEPLLNIISAQIKEEASKIEDEFHRILLD